MGPKLKRYKRPVEARKTQVRLLPVPLKGSPMPAFVMPGHDPTISEWRRDVCPPDLQRYYCVHGKYVGFKRLFRCYLCDPLEEAQEVEVEFSTHDDLQHGRLAIGRRTVEVLAAGDAEAMLLACQLVATVLDVMPTRATIRV